jgi:hypothetical protein
MRHNALLCALAFPCVVMAQPPCSCGAKEDGPVVVPDTVFQLDSALALACCGWIDRNGPEPLYRGFTLGWCGTGWPLLEAGATSTFRMKVQDRALIAEDLRMLPEGADLEPRPVVWRTHVIQGLYDPSIGEPVARISEFPGTLRRLTKRERRAVREQFAAVDTAAAWTDERLLGLLFLCAAQRTPGAVERFRSLRDHHRLDGMIAGQYAEYTAMLDQLEAER